MASAEFIQKRIDGKLKEIATLEKKIERIKKAQASNWENNPYWYSERDLDYTERDLAAARRALEDYQAKLTEENDKAASRNVPAITEFLDQWEQRVIEWLLSEREKFLKANEEYYARSRELTDEWNNAYKTDNWRETQKRVWAEKDKLKKEFQSKWSHILQFNHGDKPWEETMRKDIAKEKVAKYDDLLNRIINVTGAITDASGLYIGPKGDINGVVEGEKGSAEVRTIGAGGYNIQCYHYRTLIKKLR